MPLNSLRVFLGLAPKELPKIVPVQLVIAAAETKTFDLLDKGENQEFTTCQAVYVDNRLNGAPFELRCGGTAFPVVCPSFSVGMFPIAALEKLDFAGRFTNAGTAGTVDLWLLNVPQPYFVYPVT